MSEKRKTSAVITCRVTPADRERIRYAAAQCGLGPSSWMKRAVLQMTERAEARPPRQLADTEMLRKIEAHLGKIGSNLNQIARHCNTEETAPMREDINKVLKYIVVVSKKNREAIAR